MQLLLHAIEGINRTMELKALLLKCMNSACKVMEAEASSLILVDEVTGELNVSIPTGPVKDKISGMQLPKDKGVAAWVLKNKKPYFSNDFKESELYWEELSEGFESKSIMCVPLVNSKKVAIGVIQVVNKLEGKEFQEDEISVFETLAGHVALSIEKVKEVDDLKKRIKDKEDKLKEVHQGLKSNLAAINAIIQLEVPTIEDEHSKFILRATGSRIEAISNAHHILYNQDEFEFIDLGLYLGRLTSMVSDIFEEDGKEISLLLDMDKVALRASVALTIGLIVNEVLVHLYKEAFQFISSGKITVSVKKEDDNCIDISISDNGIGLQSNLDGSEEDTLPSVIIKTLAMKLEATISQRKNDSGGTVFSILFYV